MTFIPPGFYTIFSLGLYPSSHLQQIIVAHSRFFSWKATGTFCNGRLATDFVSEVFGIKPFIHTYLDPAYGIEDFATGVSFASVTGSGYDNLTSDSVVGVVGIQYSNLDILFSCVESYAEMRHEGRRRNSKKTTKKLGSFEGIFVRIAAMGYGYN
ncbi:hypothetical protein IFM89_019565 [Coptis chinensis]|uniref:Uncharacterized protein n=1 Tax=Coptis chinensis TaxID=261450 RepID=A0A835LEX3_9MAGN|nr:hypothetical protein IFM89_019565 [Coptis chinensis]